MHPRHVCATALTALLLATPALAQRAGTVELGGYGQFLRMDRPWAVKNGIGGGGRIGFFVTPRVELEGDFTLATLDARPPRNVGDQIGYSTYAGRLTYNVPFGFMGNTSNWLLGVGLGNEKIGKTSDFSVSPMVGVRWQFTPMIALRTDLMAEWVENPADPRFDFPPPPTPPATVSVNPGAARSVNVGLRVGLSLMFGNTAKGPNLDSLRRAQADSIARARTADSLAAIEAARRDSLARAAALEQARRDSLARLEQMRRDSIAAAAAAVSNATAGLTNALTAKVFFDFDKSQIRDDQKATLDAMVPILQANPNVRIRIEGNADERGSDEYNMALGMRRATAAKRYLVSKGIAADRFETISNGEEKPVCQEHEESCWSQNRRDEFVITAGGDNLMAPKQP